VPFSFWLMLIFGRWIENRPDGLFDLELFAATRDVLIFLQDNALNSAKSASLVLIATSLYSSGNLFYHMRRSGEIIYGDKENKRGLLIRVSALFFTLLTALASGFFILFLISGYYVLSVCFSDGASRAFMYIFLALAGFFMAFIFNIYMCPYKLKSSDVLPGSALTLALWSIAVAGFRIYLRFADFSKLYGAVSTVIIFLLWLYMMTSCFVIGVIFNSEINKQKDLKAKKL